MSSYAFGFSPLPQPESLSAPGIFTRGPRLRLGLAGTEHASGGARRGQGRRPDELAASEIQLLVRDFRRTNVRGLFDQHGHSSSHIYL